VPTKCQPGKTLSIFSTTDTNMILKIMAKIRAKMRQKVWSQDGHSALSVRLSSQGRSNPKGF